MALAKMHTDLAKANKKETFIRSQDEFKDIVVADCDIKKVESLVYEVNGLILKNARP